MPKKILASIVVLTAAALVLSGCAGNPLAADPPANGGGSSSTITIGSANFPESELLGEMYAQSLEASGVTVKRQFNIGARDLYLAALKDGSIDMLPEYNGALLSALLKGGAPKSVTSPKDVYAALQHAMPAGIITLPQSRAQDKDTLTVTAETAKKYKLKTIGDLAPIAGKLVVAAGPEWADRYQGLLGLTDLYGVTFKELKPLDSGGPLTLAALLSGQAQVANLFSTDSAIQTNHFVVLDDTKDLYLSENIVPIIRKTKVTATVKKALAKVTDALTTAKLTKYLAMVQVEKKDSATVATDFLKSEGIVK
jgi:osmoprotectant transport system substrate-binding protein